MPFCHVISEGSGHRECFDGKLCRTRVLHNHNNMWVNGKILYKMQNCHEKCHEKFRHDLGITAMCLDLWSVEFRRCAAENAITGNPFDRVYIHVDHYFYRIVPSILQIFWEMSDTVSRIKSAHAGHFHVMQDTHVIHENGPHKTMFCKIHTTTTH